MYKLNKKEYTVHTNTKCGRCLSNIVLLAFDVCEEWGGLLKMPLKNMWFIIAYGECSNDIVNIFKIFM